ncbi:MAG: hypothetical protein JKY88_15860 [Pseudomonadales bacterium]|nr:hypothetical protein [Pseudomonadales bacterium]
MPETYNLIFFPTVSTGTEEEVIKSLSTTLKVDVSKVEEWFAAGKPTVLMKNVSHEVADRYREAITNCGANCNVQPSGIASGLSLEPKPQVTDLFLCPSCAYEEELDEGMTYEECPSCGLVVEKWEAKQLAEAEKAEIRRRLLRDARIQEEGVDDATRKQDELERIRAIERELMIELGIKPPGRFWMFFSSNPVSVSISLAALLVTASLALSFFLNQYIDAEEQAQLLKAAPIEEIQEAVPILAEAVSLKQSGNQSLVSELADVTENLRGSREQALQVVKAAEQMMKGIGADAFIQSTKHSSANKKLTLKAPGEPPQIPVNTDTIGGIKGLPGLDNFDDEELNNIVPSMAIQGEDKIILLMSKTLSVPDSDNPSGPNIRVSKLSKLDGSNIINLLKSVSVDFEWDGYLLSEVDKRLNKGDFADASEIAKFIKNPNFRIRALSNTMEKLVKTNPNVNLQSYQSQFGSELQKIQNVDRSIALRLDLATRLGDNGFVTEPFDTIEVLEKELNKTTNQFDKSIIAARLAVAFLGQVDKASARELFSLATKSAGLITSKSERIRAFSLIAQRYYDARNVTIANEILSEAQLFSATELTYIERGKAFAHIAFAQLYLGDLSGALISVDNASRGKARNQLLVQLAESLISVDRNYLARQLLNQINGGTLYHRLALKIAATLLFQGNADEAKGFAAMNIKLLNKIQSEAQSSLILSQYARLYARMRNSSQSSKLFSDALLKAENLRDRELSVVRGLIAINQARSLEVAAAYVTLELVEAQFVKESLGSQLRITERTIGALE